MSYKTDIELKTQVDAVIVVNGNREITPPLDNSLRTNFIDSKLNLSGGNVLLDLTGYTTELTPTDNKHLTPKKYVDDQDAIVLSTANSYTDSEISANSYDDTPTLYKDGSRDMTGSLVIRKVGVADVGLTIFANTSDFKGGFIHDIGAGVTSFYGPSGSGYLNINSSLEGGIAGLPETGFKLKVHGATKLDGSLTIADGGIITGGSSSGLTLLDATSQKLGIWNTTPIVQPTTGIAAATFTANSSAIADDTATFDGYTVGQVVKALRNIGLLA